MVLSQAPYFQTCSAATTGAFFTISDSRPFLSCAPCVRSRIFLPLATWSVILVSEGDFDGSTSLYPLLETRTSRRPMWWSTGCWKCKKHHHQSICHEKTNKRTTWTKFVRVWKVIVSATENEESTQNKENGQATCKTAFTAAHLSTKSVMVLQTGTASARGNVFQRRRQSVFYSTV